MDLDRAAADAFTDVAIRLMGGRVVAAPPLTVSEAARFAGLLDALSDPDMEERGRSLGSFVREFLARVGLLDATLAELALEDTVADSALPCSDACDLLDLLDRASWSDDIIERSRAQTDWLGRAPDVLGVSGDLPAGELFAAGQAFARSFYLHVYGLADDFCSRLATGPVAQTWEIRAPASTTAPPSPAGSRP